MKSSILLAGSILFALVPTANASIRLYVSATASPGGDGFTWATAFNDLQAALSFAATHSGQSQVNEIWVAQGTYKPTTNVNDPFATFNVVNLASMYGGFAGSETLLGQRDPVAHPTILSGDLAGDDGPDFANMSDNSYNVVTATGFTMVHTTVIDGFTIRSGRAQGANPRNSGSGLRMLNCSPIVSHCTFVGNFANALGGAVSSQFSTSGDTPLFQSCTFTGNRALSSGGALAVSNLGVVRATCSDCSFIDNISDDVGGAFSGDGSDLLRCSFVNNSSQHEAGAAALSYDSTVLDCVFIGNHSQSSFGGAVFTLGNSFTGGQLGNGSTFTNCLFAHNSSGYKGGAVCAMNSNGLGPTFTNCTVADNSAAQIGGGLFFIHNSGNPGTSSLPIVENCIAWGNMDASGIGEQGQISISNATLTIDYSDVQGWTGALGGNANFGADPQFANPSGCDGVPGTLDDDYRPSPNSPVVDSGDRNALPTDSFDQDGDQNTTELLPLDLDRAPRVFGGAVDIGAYEVHGTYPLVFCFGDGSGAACPCSNSGTICHGCANSKNAGGALLTLTGAAVPDATTGTDTLVLRISGTPMTANCIFLQGSAQLSTGVTFGDGVRCAAGSLKRLGLKTSAGGTCQYPSPGDLSISARSAMLGDPILGSGFTRYYQTYYRDPSPSFCPDPPGNTWNVSSGLVVQW